MVEKFLSKDLREPKFVLNLQPVQGPSFRSLSLSLSHAHTPSQIHALTFSHSLSLCGTHSHALTFTNTHLLSLFLNSSYSTCTLSLSLSLCPNKCRPCKLLNFKCDLTQKEEEKSSSSQKTRTGLHRVFINAKNFWRIKISQRQCWRLQVRHEGRFSLTKVVPHVSLPLPSLIPMLHSAMTTDV